MEIDTLSFEDNFDINNKPDWFCSTCNKGKVIFDESKISKFETNESKKDFQEKNKNWSPYLIYRYFNGTMTCNNESCKETYIISGEITFDPIDYNKKDSQFIECYSPQYIYPTICIFKLSDDIPEEVRSSIELSFKLFWIDKPSCANAIRTCIEVIMNDRRIAKTYLNTKGKRIKLTLHKRIELFKLKNKEIADCLMATKWIGNAGSHVGDLSNYDVLDGFDLLNHCIEKLYGTFHKELLQKTRIINKRRKPIG